MVKMQIASASPLASQGESLLPPPVLATLHQLDSILGYLDDSSVITLKLLVLCGVSWRAVSCYIKKLPVTLIRNHQLVYLLWLSFHYSD